jgi:hypothetical protein
LGSPEQTSTYTEKGTGKDVEATDTGMFRGEQADGIDAVSNSAKGESALDTEFVDKGATEETKDSEGRVESRVL